MDLHSEDSQITTNTIIKLAKKASYKIQVLPETIKETRNLLEKKAETIEKVNIFSAQKKHTIEAGCARRKIKRQELLVYAERIEEFLKGKEIEIISEEINASLMQGLEKTEIYKTLSKRPFNIDGVSHDAAAMNYIKSIRNPEARNFSEVDAFFVTDTTGFLENKITQTTQLPYIIRAEELLNVLWLSNPMFDSNVIISNVSRMMTLHLDQKLPDKEMLRRIDEKIEKFSDLGLDKEACVELALNIAEVDTKQLVELLNIDEKDKFNEMLLEMAVTSRKIKDEKERERIKEYDELLVYLEEEKQIEKGEAIAAMEKKIIDIRSQYDDFSRIKEREHLDDLLVRDSETKSLIEEDIIAIKARCKRKERIVFMPIIVLIIIGLLYIILAKVINDWQNVEPWTYIISLIPIIFAGILYIFTGKSISYKKAINNIKEFINHNDISILRSKENELNIVNKRIEELNRRKLQIIE